MTPTEPVVLRERVHLIGIGGAGMSGIARILLARGAVVSGSDAKDSRIVLALRALGARVEVGHDPAHLPQAPATVVVSSAIWETNPELAAARERGLEVAHRAQALAALTTGRLLACVTGTAGKTSTTSMLTVALQHAGLDPSFAIGGDLASSGSGAHEGTGDVFVAEADESDASFLAFGPTVAVVTNVEADHLDHYGTPQAYVDAFGEFLARITPGGTLVACADDPGAADLARLAESRGIRVRRYGHGAVDAELVEFRPDGAGARIVLRLAGTEHRLRLGVPGEHMALNALGALLAGVELGAPADVLLEGLAAFDGVRRRFEFKGRADGVAVYDDYAHHPSKVAAQLRAARDVVAGTGRVVVAFQPHLYSRTREFAAEFGRALALADEVVVLDVFGAREDPEPGVTGALVADAVPLPAGHVHFVPGWSDVPGVVAGIARPGDLVITMGAGDVTVLGPEVLLELERRP
ncbi:UDP-N-acetylmuramate--L-alanine ligase [Pseudonocardia sp. KRD-184]|uniref:UDP-N-acetylmuramate--L-alanine ligase n=1 Tax=Pseudonocardia oceani TaxID=2792013 RepID=A0ABS6UFM9_9PSEU|nr:UDP-N-acetylmuramate--L-alanine ligase [Pseudonocardia oceani]MBW0092087.1 UDP-N-acetylmuramate--L-alanine ligase [Pseudonocardia oceani]MBW0099087.1 UDP-N-acetylmuramate--L-alanine ligase [Pseudonocardia oceani]MBW0112732.1 UDP-N-acetylmuramate--L-alanine ligase [Pseudonocardia oceani]MBW0121156.1 UDP-N-acetylmuramate--L-alanine ligase [Pseudonocardia oceani]MBW0131028.1 UDP-N-acetylmuramate--L-alanine ligase [Pseudonocardia oceani]